MKDKYDRQLKKWARGHYWDSLEKDKDLILRHLRTFAGEFEESCENCPEWEILKHKNYPWLIYCPSCGRLLK
jgi:hypothetical protein